MPYNSPKDLPDSVKDNLPQHAQIIFMEAFNSARENYKEEETAFKVAWSAVKKKYKKRDDKWVEK
jgi:cation transport regulator